MIDHIGGFASEEVALAFQEWAQYHTTVEGPNGPVSVWDPSKCITPILIWNPAFDTVGEDGGIIHQPYDMIWRVMVSLPEVSEELMASTMTQIVFDNETGQVLLTRYFTEAWLQILWMQPIFAGSKYPFQTGDGGIAP